MKAINEQISAIIAKLHDKSNNKIEKQIHPMLVQITQISSKQIENIQKEVLTNTFEHPSSEDNFESKFQANIYPYNQRFEQLEE